MANTIPTSITDSINSTKVTYKRLGKSGLKVSVPIFGAMSVGSKEWQPWVEDDEDKVTALFKAAYDCGLNTWDTANVYSNGESERLMGRAIKRLQIPRQKITILTKCFATVGEEPAAYVMKYPQMKATKDYVNQNGLSRAAIFNAVDASLERLQTNYIDLLQIHRFDPDTPAEETMKALHDLIQLGKVRYIGASSMWTFEFQEMQNTAEKHGWTKFVSMQNQYSLCYREEEREMIKFCNKTGVGLIPWSPLYAGHLARPPGGPLTVRAESLKGSTIFKGTSDADVEIVQRVHDLAKEKGWAQAQVALAWVIGKGAIPIVGFSSIERLQQAVEVNGKTLTEDEVKHLEEPYVPKAIAGHS